MEGYWRGCKGNCLIMADAINIGSGDSRVRIEGLGQSMRALSKAGADSEDMKDLMHAIGMIVVRASTPPSITGTLAGTVRAGRGKTKAVVRAGGARAPYAGVIHYGWPQHNIEAQPFITQALQSEQNSIFNALNDGIGDILKKNDLK